MKIPSWLEKQILSHPGTVIHGTARAAEQPQESQSKPLVTPSVEWSEDGTKLIITVPVETKSEANARQWRARSNRSNAAWRAMSRTVGPHVGLLAPFAKAFHHDGLRLKVLFVRLGGRALDRLCNLPSSMKGCEDSLAFFLGVDDADPRWQARCEQEPGAEAVGVRIEMEVE